MPPTVIDEAFTWGDDRPPKTPSHRTLIYEMHVKGFTARHPDIPQNLRGTYAGIAHPAIIEHLTDLVEERLPDLLLRRSEHELNADATEALLTYFDLVTLEHVVWTEVPDREEAGAEPDRLT